MLCGDDVALAETVALRDSAIIGSWKFLRVIELQEGLGYHGATESTQTCQIGDEFDPRLWILAAKGPSGYHLPLW
jgi:hypothetical protein